MENRIYKYKVYDLDGELVKETNCIEEADYYIRNYGGTIRDTNGKVIDCCLG